MFSVYNKYIKELASLSQYLGEDCILYLLHMLSEGKTIHSAFVRKVVSKQNMQSEELNVLLFCHGIKPKASSTEKKTVLIKKLCQ